MRTVLHFLGFCAHDYGFPHAPGYRRPDGRFVRVAGPDRQTCRECGHERESMIQFGAREAEAAGK